MTSVVFQTSTLTWDIYIDEDNFIPSWSNKNYRLRPPTEAELRYVKSKAHAKEWIIDLWAWGSPRVAQAWQILTDLFITANENRPRPEVVKFEAHINDIDSKQSILMLADNIARLGIAIPSCLSITHRKQYMQETTEQVTWPTQLLENSPVGKPVTQNSQSNDPEAVSLPCAEPSRSGRAAAISLE